MDTWGVDYALLGKRANFSRIPITTAIRAREGVMDEVFHLAPPDAIYATTGIQFMPINTLYQLFAAKREVPAAVPGGEYAAHDSRSFSLLAHRQSGLRIHERDYYSVGRSREHAHGLALMDALGLPARLPAAIAEPGTVIGRLLAWSRRDAALAGTPVIAPASHDTGSAVAADYSTR